MYRYTCFVQSEKKAGDGRTRLTLARSHKNERQKCSGVLEVCKGGWVWGGVYCPLRINVSLEGKESGLGCWLGWDICL